MVYKLCYTYSRGHNMQLTKISLDKDNRMLRCGIGKNKGLYFIRVDLWFFGIRLKIN